MGSRRALVTLVMAVVVVVGATAAGRVATAAASPGPQCPHDQPGRPCGMPDPPGRGCGIPENPGREAERGGGVGRACDSPTTTAVVVTTSAPAPTTTAVVTTTVPAPAAPPVVTTTTTTTSTTSTVAPVEEGAAPVATTVARPAAAPAAAPEVVELETAAAVEEPAEVLGVVQEADAPPPPPVDDLSDISTGIPDRVDFTPAFVVTNVGFGALMVLLLVAASQLFNDALKMHHDGMVERLVARSAVAAGVGGAFSRLPRVHPLVTFAASAGVLALLADPSVSLSVATIGQVIGMAIGLGAIVAIYEIPAARRIEREAGVHEPFRLFPIAIVIAIGCLLFSRIFGVAPGVLYGLFAGVLFTSVDTEVAGRAYARSSILLGAAAMVAWLIHRWIAGSATGASASLWAIVFDTAAAVLFVGGLQSVIVQLLPMPFTYGESVAAWSRTVWLTLFVGALALYMQFVVRPNPDAGHWTNLWFVAAFMALAVGFWGWCAYQRWRRMRSGEADAAVDDVAAPSA